MDEEVRAVALYGFVGTLVYMNRLISFLLYEILRDPSLRDTITREVDAAFGDGCPSVATLRTMKTLYTAYLETLRFHPIALALPFIANEDFVFHDYSIRKGQYLFVSLVPNHFSAEHYREPERFDAGRCAAPRNEHRHPGSFAPFGAATRFCAAQGLVEIITLSLVATLLRTVDLEIEPAGYRLKTRLAPLPGPEQGFTIRVTAQRERPVTVAPSVLAPKESFVNLLRNLESSEFAETMRSVTSATYGPGDVIVAEGDPADRFYIIQDGEVEVTRHAAGTPPRVLNRLGPGDFFGELGLLEGGRRHATVSAVGTSPVRTLVLDREGFMNLVAGSDMISDEITQAVRHRYVSSRLSDAFPRMDRAGLDRLLPEFRLSRHEPGDLLIREGDAPDRFFILTKGRTQVLNKGIHGKEVVLADLGPGSWFGEIGLLKGIPRTATVRAETPVETLELDRDGFQKLIAADESIKVDFEALMSRRLTQMDAERKT